MSFRNTTWRHASRGVHVSSPQASAALLCALRSRPVAPKPPLDRGAYMVGLIAAIGLILQIALMAQEPHGSIEPPQIGRTGEQPAPEEPTDDEPRYERWVRV